MQSGCSKDWGRGGRHTERPIGSDHYLDQGGPSRTRSYSPNEVRGTGRRYNSRESIRGSHAPGWSTSHWDSPKDYDHRSGTYNNYQHRSSYSSRAHSSSPNLSRNYESRPRGSPLDWNPESPIGSTKPSHNRFTEEGLPDQEIQGESSNNQQRSYWSSTYKRHVEQYEYNRELKGPPAMADTHHEIQIAENSGIDKEASLNQLRNSQQNSVGSPTSQPEPINVLELANKISSLGPLIRDPRLLTRILKITKTEDALKEDSTSSVPFAPSSSNPVDSHSRPPISQEVSDQISRQNKLSEYSQKYKIVKKSNPLAVVGNTPKDSTLIPTQASEMGDNSKTQGQAPSTVKDATLLKNLPENSISKVLSPNKSDVIMQKSSTNNLAEGHSVPHFASKAQTLVKDSFLKLKQEGRAKMSTPTCKSNSKQNQALLKRVVGSKDTLPVPNNPNSPFRVAAATTKNSVVKLPGLKNILNSCMKTSISEVLRNKMNTSKSPSKPEIKTKDKVNESSEKKKEIEAATPTVDNKAENDVKTDVEKANDSSIETNKEEPESSKSNSKELTKPIPKDASKSPVATISRARKGQSSSEKSQTAQNQSQPSEKPAGNKSASFKIKKKNKKRHFRGGTYNLYLSANKKRAKKKAIKEFAQADDEMSLEGTETTGSHFDSEDDVSYASEEMLTASEKSFQEEEVTPPKSSGLDGQGASISLEEREEITVRTDEENNPQLDMSLQITDNAATIEVESQVLDEKSDNIIPEKNYETLSLEPKEPVLIETEGVKECLLNSSSEIKDVDVDNKLVPDNNEESMPKQEFDNSNVSYGIADEKNMLNEKEILDEKPELESEKPDKDLDLKDEKALIEKKSDSITTTEEKMDVHLDMDAVDVIQSDECSQMYIGDDIPLSPANSDTVGSSAESHTLSDGEINKENTPFKSQKHPHSIASSVKNRQRFKRRHSDNVSTLNNLETPNITSSESPFKKPKRVPTSELSTFTPPVLTHALTNLAKIANSTFPKLDVIYDHNRLQHEACTCQAKPLAARHDDSTETAIYCQAVDSIDEKLIGCCNIVTKPQLVRPSVKIPFTAMCEVHLWRLRLHHCCPVCGVFCSQGSFMQCTTSKWKNQIHLFHKCCLIFINEVGIDQCPHCSSSDSLKMVLLELNTPTAPTFYLSQKPLFSEPRAKMTITRFPSGDKSIPEDLSAEKYVIQETEKVLSSAGLPLGPERSKLDTLLKDLSKNDLDSSKYSSDQLYKASKDGDEEIILEMLALGFDPNLKETDQLEEVPLHAASMNGHLIVVHLLIQAGASMDLLDGHLYTPLMLAVENHQIAVTQYLIKAGAQLLAKGEDGMTCLHLAARCGSVAICKLLLDTGRILANIQDDGGWTPIVWAAEHSHLDIVRLLVERGADPTMRDNEQNIALHWSAFSGNVDISHLFLDLGSDLNTTNMHGDTPLHIATRQNKYACVVLFLARTANIEAVNKENETPIMCCADTDSQTYMALMLNSELKQISQTREKKGERVVHNDISRGKETNLIQCVNGVDDDGVPSDYMYVIENCETSPINIDRTITSLQSCRCEDDCTSPNCTCATLSFKCWFDNDGRLLPEFNLPDPPMIFECNKACLCWKNCNNRALQHGILCRLQLFRTHNKGWGVRTLKDIPKGTFICEYIGEIITDGQADQREDDSYLFDLDNRQDGETYCLDARYYGNISRFVNHQCEPNLVPVKVFVDHQDLSFPRIAFFSSRDIYAKEELGFDYGEKFWVIKYKSFTCDCGSPNCKYSKDTIHQTLENYYRRLKEEHVEESLDGQQDASNLNVQPM